MADEVIPFWAQTMLTDLAVIKTSLPAHIAATDRSLEDHEARLRVQESTSSSLVSTLERIVKLEENELEIFTRLRKLEMRLWMAMGGLTVIVTGIEIYSNLVANGAVK